MGKIVNPITVSGHFPVDSKVFENLGILDVTLATDTRLFIDPLLFGASQHVEFNTGAVNDFRKYFAKVIAFLAKTKGPGDVAWRTATRLLSFPEINGTCLGYGTASINGSGWGEHLTRRAVRVGREIVELGITDPDLFLAMAFFEEDFGPDRISDMATRVALDNLEAFNRRVLTELGLTGEEFEVDSKNRIFLRNPYSTHPTPVILVPHDILRPLPIAIDWGGVQDAAHANQALRTRVNVHIAEIWRSKTKKDKKALRSQVMSSPDAFSTLLDAIHAHPRLPYDIVSDPEGLVFWPALAERVTQQQPLALEKPLVHSLDELDDIVTQIIDQFKQLVENNGLNKELYSKTTPRHESSAQRLFFAIAYAYCKASNVDISPEADSGNGPVDFKFSSGFDKKVLVEVKLSKNSKVVSGYKKQLEAYKAAEDTQRAHYLLLNVGSMGNKLKGLDQANEDALKAGGPVSAVHVVDARLKPSASKL